MKNGLRWLVAPAFPAVTVRAAAQGGRTPHGGNFQLSYPLGGAVMAFGLPGKAGAPKN